MNIYGTDNYGRTIAASPFYCLVKLHICHRLFRKFPYVSYTIYCVKKRA